MRTDSRPFIPGVLLAAAISVPLTGCDQERTDLSSSASDSTVATDIDDTRVTTKVKSALSVDADVSSFDLKVEIRKGVVQLSAFVDSHVQMGKAIIVARAGDGVTSVGNEMRIKQ
jgi:hyperosmotically inducible protein